MERKQHKPRLLVTGASGVLGWTLCEMAAKSWETFGTVYHHPVDPSGVHVYKIDLTNNRSLRDFFSAIRPNAVVHAAGLSSPDYCQEHPDESELINVKASANIATLCAELAIPCVLTSSDLVFDGEHAPYAEDHLAQPISVYGEHKLRAEAEMRERYPNTTICRLPLLFGVGSPVAEGFLARMLQAMKKGEDVRLFVDEIRTPVSTETAARGLLLALRKAKASTLHLGGMERISRWDLGRLSAEVFLSGHAHLVPFRQRDLPMKAPRPHDVSLDSSKAARIGYQPGAIREQMCRLRSNTVW